jgi:ribosome biogenesis GTPase / thiamine phosphate phosphatase
MQANAHQPLHPALCAIGWSADHEAEWQARADQAPTDGPTPANQGPTPIPARVILEHRGFYTVATEQGERLAELSGRLRHDAQSRLDLPAVGDWVAVRPDPNRSASALLVLETLPRASALLRKIAGDTTAPQLVAANVDTAIMLMGLDENFNVRRLERYLTAIRAADIQPIILLTKADLCDDLPEKITAAAAAAGPDTPLFALDLLHDDLGEVLDPWLTPQSTLVLLGSSGVGKSTLTNHLLGEALQRTAQVSDERSQGRHTTTHRQLFTLPCGALLIDTPGMREFQPWDASPSSLADAFEDINALTERCQYRDCQHEREPNCAIQAALADATLPPERLAAFRKLQRELKHLAIAQDKALRIQEHRKRKTLTRAVKLHAKMSPKW